MSMLDANCASLFPSAEEVEIQWNDEAHVRYSRAHKGQVKIVGTLADVIDACFSVPQQTVSDPRVLRVFSRDTATVAELWPGRRSDLSAFFAHGCPRLRELDLTSGDAN